MKKFTYLPILVTLLSVFSVFSQKNTYSSLTIPIELKEDANAVVRDDLLEITIKDVDEMVVYNRKVITILNKLGDRHASMYEGYDNDTKISKLSAYIYDAFGNQIKKYSKGKFLDQSAVDGGTLYSDSRVKFVDYTPISYPYTIVFQSEYKTSSTGFIPNWYPVNGYFISVEKSLYKLNNPKNITLRKKEKNFDSFTIEDNSTEFNAKYFLENQKAIKYENSSVSYREILPNVKFALNDFSLKGVKGKYSNWNEFGKWMNQKLLSGRDVLDAATVSKIKNLVKDTKDTLERAKLVYKYMQNKTRYISVQVGIGGWEPIAANKVDRVGYGDCKGLTNYTKALLDAAGVTSYYTIVYAMEKRNIDKDFSSIQGNHVILNLPYKGKDVWLECTSQNAPFGFLGDFTDDRNVLVVKPTGGEIKRTSRYNNEDSLQEINATIQLEKDGSLVADLTKISKGLQYDDKYHFENFSKEKLIKRYKSSTWSYNNNLEIESVNLTNDKDSIVFKENLKINISNYATVTNEEYLFRVNVFNKTSYVPKRYRKRKLPLKISTGYKDVDVYTFKLPEGYKLDVLPSLKELKTKFGTYNVSFIKIDETSFKYQKSILINEGVYPKEDYKLYRSFRRSIAKYENLRIAIIKK